MKSFTKWILTGFIGGLSLGQFEARADLEVSASVQISAVANFHAPLAPHGTWVEVGTLGRCWQPARVGVGWQPYCHGSWVWTDCGWYWASDEPWGWACYHYGTWTHDSLYGWVWVPGIEWGPAWVSWRFGGGYCGWAPLAPRGIVTAPKAFVFVDVGRFHEPVPPATLVVNNTVIMKKTHEIGSIQRKTRDLGGGTVQTVVVNEGPSANVIHQATGRTISTTPIREAAGHNPVPPEAVTKIKESQKKERPPAQEKITPAESKGSPQPPVPQTPSDQDKRPDQIKPAPPQPAGPIDPEKRGKRFKTGKSGGGKQKID